jgi:hypothetical protein
MSINWQELLTTLGGGGLLLAAAAWLIKALITQGLTRDAEVFKARIKAESDVEIERLKSSLEMIAYEHQVRFANLHARRAEIIAEIYSQMIDVQRHGQRFVYTDVFNQAQDRRQAYDTTLSKLLDFYFLLQKHRIYLPESICTLMDGFENVIRRSVIRTNMYEPIENSANPKFLEEKVKVIQEASDAFERTIPAARAALEKEFRRLLGVEGDKEKS